ncbi:MAG: FG-GAP-like repeat-containing protein [Patescibacteria group bacterium]|nr:FG-GAP-like repeat-containing protein [Patescibacteria group bacterium]
MDNQRPFLATRTTTKTGTTVAATAMLTLSATALFLAWGMLVVLSGHTVIQRETVHIAFVAASAPESIFIRGDVDGSGKVDLSDANKILSYLYSDDQPGCLDASDADDSGKIEVADAVYLLKYLFLAGLQPSAPFPSLGADQTPDNLGCPGGLLNLSGYHIQNETYYDAAFARAFLDAERLGASALYIPPGNYPVTNAFRFVSGVNVFGDPHSPPVFEGGCTNCRSNTFVSIEQTDLKNVTLRNLQFKNIRLSLNGSNNYYQAIKNVTFTNCDFSNGWEDDDWNANYLSLVYSDDVTIEHCTFRRSSQAYAGRGIVLYRTHHSVVRDSFFGTSNNLESASVNGYFKTAINIQGYKPGEPPLQSDEIRIFRNVIQRQPPDKCPTDDHGNPICQDHGIYGWGFNGVDIIDNRVGGWDTTGGGGGIKLRNGSFSRVMGNVLTSGMLYYTDRGDAEQPLPEFFKNVWVHSNTVNLEGPPPQGYRDINSADFAFGIYYQRNFDLNDPVEWHEEGLVFTDNYFLRGGQISILGPDPSAFCIANNPEAKLYSHEKSQISEISENSSCTLDEVWMNKPVDLFVSDFNGDGVEDFIYFDKHPDTTGRNLWTAHLSDLFGFHTVRIMGGDGVSNFSAETNLYRGGVGDFDGDSHNEIILRGKCGADTRACWQVWRYVSEGIDAPDGLLEMSESGPESGESGNAFRPDNEFNELILADFNGDGRTEIAYVGICGDDNQICFRVHRWDAETKTFIAEKWGGGMRISSETLTYGLNAGDFNGDRRADLVYRGLCGNDAHACWRVQQSEKTGTGFIFSANDFGNNAWFSADSSLLGLQLSDVNGDGKTDIGYRGKCGDGHPCWRVHLSTGSYFQNAVDYGNDTPFD